MSRTSLPLHHAKVLRRQMAVWRVHLCHADPPVRLEGMYAIREIVDTLILQEDTTTLPETAAYPARLVTQQIAHIRRPS